MRDDRATPEVDMIAESEGLFDLSQAQLEELQQVVVADVAGGDDKQSRGRTVQQMTVATVRVLGDDDPTVLVGQGRDLLIGGSVAVRERRGVERVVAELAEPGRQPDRQLGVDEDLTRRRGVRPIGRLR